MTTIVESVASWQYQFDANTLPVPAIPAAGWLNGISPFGKTTAFQMRNPPQTEWLPGTALWMRRTVTLPEGNDFWIDIEIENSVFVYWDGTLISDVNPTNSDISDLGRVLVRLTKAQSTPGDHTLVLFCMDEATDFGAGDDTYINVEVYRPAIVVQQFEEPIHEEWNWLTDLQTAFDGTETSTPLLRNPNRMFSGSALFATEASLRKHISDLFKSAGELFYMPLFQYGVTLKAAMGIGDTVATVNSLRGDFREQSLAILIEGTTYEVVMVDTIDASSVTFSSGLIAAFSKRAVLYPLTRVYAQPQSMINRRTVDSVGNIEYRTFEYEPWAPFVSPLNTTELDTYDSLPILDAIPFGPTFEQALQSGLVTEDFIGLPALFVPWSQGKFTIALRFLCNRVFDLDSWFWWMAFADYCLGASNPFLFPTNRADLAVVTPAVGSGSTVVVESHDYATNYWGLDTFARIAIESDAGIHHATITGVAASGDNDQLTFTPALPAGAGWDSNQKISFLLKVRLASDKISLDHYGLRTEIGFSIRTVS